MLIFQTNQIFIYLHLLTKRFLFLLKIRITFYLLVKIPIIVKNRSATKKMKILHFSQKFNYLIIEIQLV